MKDEERAKLEQFAKIQEGFEREEKLRKELEEQNIKLLKEKNDLFTQLQSEREGSGNAEDKIQKLVLQKNDLETQLKDLGAKLSEEEAQKADLNSKKKKLEQDIDDLKKEMDELGSKMNKGDNENKSKENQMPDKTQKERVKSGSPGLVQLQKSSSF